MAATNNGTGISANATVSPLVQDAVSSFMDTVLHTETLEEVFAGFIIESKENDEIKRSTYEREFKQMVQKVVDHHNQQQQQAANNVAIDALVKEYANRTGCLLGDRQINAMLDMLEYGVVNSIIPAKSVCEAILSSPHMHHENEAFWSVSFSLIHRIISHADYKGVRDQLKTILDKVHSIPANANISFLPLLGNMYSVLELIFDRNASLLPAYLVLDEIQKKMYPKGKWPHWKFAKLLSDFVDSFQPTAQMVTIAGRCKLLPVIGYSSTLGNAWKLDPISAKLQLRGLLPYSKELLQPQTELLRYVLEQPYSKDMVCAMLGLNNKTKQRCPILEDQMVELILIAMDRSESDSDIVDQGSHPTLFLWQHLSSHLIYFVLFHYTSFPHMVMSLHAKLMCKNFKKGREHLMWVLLQFISGAIQKNPLNDFLPIMKLHDLLYQETEPIPVPDITKPGCTHALSAASIWIHLMKKAESEPSRLQRQLPIALQLHYEYLQQICVNKNNSGGDSNGNLMTVDDYRISLLCNAYSTNQESFARPMGMLLEAVQSTNRPPANSSSAANGTAGGTAINNMSPLSMDLLDSLTVHAKMSLIHSIVTSIMKMSQSKTGPIPSPALIETYSRLLIYTEIETLGIKGFMSQVLNQVFRAQSWSILHMLLEMFVYRLHHVPVHYRVQLLGSLHNLAAAPQTNQIQLHLCMESTALKLILGLSSAEVLAIPQFARFSDPKALISNDSEELNKVLVLTLSRAIHVTGSESLSAAGSWCKELLSIIMSSTPLQWSSFTLACFPPVIAEFFKQYQGPGNKDPQQNKEALKRSVEEEYKKWKAMTNDNDKISHFSQQSAAGGGNHHLFLCLLWKMVLESENRQNLNQSVLPAVAYKILDRIGARGLSLHLRSFADFLVNELAASYGGQHLKKSVDALNDMVWRCNVITLDRLLLCLSLRAFEGNNSKVCLLICMLLLERQEFKARVEEFVSENSPQHWKQSDWHKRHTAFQQKWPEKLFFENLPENPAAQSASGPGGSNNQYLPVYFSNICLRFIPVIDIIIHRFIELPSVPIPVETLLDRLGCLYKFHERPLTYLYQTLHFYDQKLKDRPIVKKKLVNSVISSFQNTRPCNWALSEPYLVYMKQPSPAPVPSDAQKQEPAPQSDPTSQWIPDLDYYIKLISRLVETLAGKSGQFPHMDWRFNEFQNASSHALHVTCIELMALPVSATSVASNLLDVCLVGHKVIPRNNIESWMNAVGLVLTAMPDSYWSVLLDKILDVMRTSELATAGALPDPFRVMDFKGTHNCMNETPIGYMIGLTHAVWHHASVGQVSLLANFLKERVKPELRTEEQFIFICTLLGPFLQRFYVERTRIVMDVTTKLYEFLGIIDATCEKLRFMDSICDLLYHIKYMFTGDSVKNEVEPIIRNLRPQLQLRLRFITHLNVDVMEVSGS